MGTNSVGYKRCFGYLLHAFQTKPEHPSCISFQAPLPPLLSTAGFVVIAGFHRCVFSGPSQCYSSTINPPGEPTCGIFPRGEPSQASCLTTFSTRPTCRSAHSTDQLLILGAFSQYELELEFRSPMLKFLLLLKVQVHPLASQRTAKSTSPLPATNPMLLFLQMSVRILILLLKAAL